MEIELMKRAGVPPAEIEAHQRIQREFDQTPFSKNWHGYASFALARGGRGTGDDDFDLLLVTHTNIIIIELKNWNGRHLQSSGQKWFLDGEDRGDSPVAVVNRKVPKLVNQMKHKLGPEKTPFIRAYVVMHGHIQKTEFSSKEEENSVLNMDELLSFRYEDCYKKYLGGRPRFNPLDYLSEYDDFFRGPSFKPKIYYIDGFRPEGEAIFVHPKNLYTEYRAVAKDDPNTQALLRQWDFLSMGMELIGENDRHFIGLREQRIYDYVSERDEELSLSLMRPLARKGPKDVTTDFAELYRLPPRITRLTEFIHSTLHKLSSEERLDLVKALINRFSALHDLRVAHRDIGGHSLWVDRPVKVVISGFPTAYYPEMKTLGSFREKVKVEQSTVPEDPSDGRTSTPYHRDVFMLGVLAYAILFGESLPRVNGVFEWVAWASDSFNGRLDSWFKQALQRDPLMRFVNARQMLEALNAVTANDQKSIIDYAAFEAFKAETRERDYQEVETYHDGEDYTCFKSEGAQGECIVKVWHGVEPDERRPDKSIRLLSFLERARAIKGCGISGLPSVIDFGLSKRSLLLVMGWVAGTSISEWLRNQPSLERRLKVAQSVVDTLDRIHALDLAHGDVHPENLIIGNEDTTVFIDVLDFQHHSSDDSYTTAYLPDNYKSLSPFERDRFSLAAVLVEVLGSTREEPKVGEFPIQRVYDELSRLLDGEVLSSLDPLKGALAATAKEGDDEEVPTFTITVQNLAYYGVAPGEMLADNNHFHISVQRDRRDGGVLRFRITGVGRQLLFGWHVEKGNAEFLKVEAVPQSVLLRTQTMSDARIPVRLNLADGPANDIHEFVGHLLNLDRVKRKLPHEAALENCETEKNYIEAMASDAEDISHQVKTPVSKLWRALLEAEEESIRTVVVAGERRDSPYKNGQVLVPYHTDVGVIDYDSSDTVIVHGQSVDGTWRTCGQLSLRDTTFGQLAELAVDNPSIRATFHIGNRLRLISTLEQGSFTRRRFAVERILDEKAVIPELINYFERGSNQLLDPVTYPAPTEEDLDVYSQANMKLNPSQREAFKRVVCNGPVGLLQGPPGTGKTSFIAALLHYLITKERARRILLVSQAHEAVNNAIEKALDLCRSHGLPFDAVRLGSESATSAPIRHLHANSIEQSYRERFRAEQKERIVQLASSLGLSKEFTNDFTELHLRLGCLERHITKLEDRGAQTGEDSDHDLGTRLRALTETFFDIARDVYEFSSDMPPRYAITHIENAILEEYEIRSLDAVDRLRRLIRLSEEWLGALGSPDGNFVEFLAKSRTVVAGTCVGIGYRGAGVVQNIYDWVIIDEAGRAAPSELAVAMQAGRRVLLVGDHQQLRPTFSEEVTAVVQNRFAVDKESEFFASDFERIFDSEYGKKVGATLLTQYRMAPAIGELVSHCFYSDKLQTERPVPPEYYDVLPEYLSKQVLWIDTAPLGDGGNEQFSADRKDKWNESEAKVIMGVLRQIVEADVFLAFLEEDLKPQEPAIGIICMYRKQREFIDRMKAEATWLGDARRLVKVDTVDSYQGKENRIIILSTVRNNRHMNPGFLRSPNRINVALSRAMERLVIVGSAKMWKDPNSELPLGKVLAKIEKLQEEDKALIRSAEHFMRI